MSYDVLVCGDFYIGPHAGGRLGKIVEEENYSQLFGDLYDDLKSSKLSIVNLEGPVLEAGVTTPKTGPSISMKPSVLKALSDVKIDLVTLANNHIMDYGINGITETISRLKEINIDYVGAGINKNEISKPFLTIINSKKVAIINVCEHEWITDFHSEAGANGLDFIENYYKIQELKTKADFVIVIYHGGNEYHPLPSPQIKKIFRFFVESGASAVIGHHTHTFSGYEVYKDCPIFYSLGNFIFDSNKESKGENWNKGISVGFNIIEKKLIFEIIPFIQNDREVGMKKMNDIELTDFDSKMKLYNSIISNDLQLTSEYDKFAAKKQLQYMSFINPYEGKISSLYKKGYLPSVFSKNKVLLLLNLMRCESHKALLERILNIEINKNNLK
jgi:poly-gamma-glutamate capsule biosynthesis protein CapA/YwtB (metallophosphatase superfamily)